MLTRMTQFSVVALVVLTGCHISDAPTSKAAAPDVLSSDAGSVRISGLSQFHQTALVVTDACRTFKYETDRQAAARATIDQTLGSQASGLPGGLQLTVESLSLRMRCHTAGAGALSSYCAAEASLALAATAKDRNGQAISVTASKDATAQVAVGFFISVLCADGMPAVTKAVDSALAGALADIQNGVTARTGIPAR
jgi:hypothetical protein